MRLALARLNPTIGDLGGNAALAERAIREARDAGADLIVLSELAICGYPPKDLLLHEGFVAACVAGADRVGASCTAGLTAVIGTPTAADPGDPRSPIRNSLRVYRNNRLVETYDKRLLPTYDVFDEDRYFEPGSRAVVIDVGGVRVGLAICEDLWKGQDAGFSKHYRDAPDPVEELARWGVGLIVSPSASPFVLGKTARHREILRRHATERGLYVASINQLGGNDDLVFDGQALVYGPDGGLLASGGSFRDTLLVADIPADPAAPPPRPRPAAPEPDEQLLFHALVLGVRDYLRKTGFRDAIIGLSGGVDSALTATLAVAALGRDHVRGLAMPGKYSSEHAIADARALAANLGIRLETISIGPPMDAFRGVLDPALGALGQGALGAALPDVAEENLQSRIRGTLLMAISNRGGAMVLTTGNKSEFAVGYCTLYGDMNGGLAVLADVSKQLVYRLSRWINANAAACGFAAPPIPERSITKAPSAELAPNQTDQDTLPPYDVLDPVVERIVESRWSPRRIAEQSGFDPNLVARIARMIDAAEYKRRQAALGLKVTSVAFGAGRRMPIAQGWRG